MSFGLLPRGPGEIALLTRSMAEILLEVAAGIEVPRGPMKLAVTRGLRRRRASMRSHPQ